MSGLHWSTERHARTPQASVLFALIFARGASIFCSKRAACLSCASPSSAHRSQPCSCPCIGSCTSRHHTCGVNAWPWPGARTSAAAKGERQIVSRIQLYWRVSSLQTLPNLACEDRFSVREMPSSDLRTLSFWCFVNGPDLRNGHPHSQLEIAICSVVN